ncbi:hypothetical protein BC826DRAFT_674582 [Russula brevipes]|nr:hypothetical protein BC826DRAFT_674582 [Russula brevipes]
MKEGHIGHQGESNQEGNQRGLFPQHLLIAAEKFGAGHVTIDMLPDDALLEIFSFYREETMYNVDFTWMWEILVHVCSRWRNIIFASPRRLDLRLLCSNRTPVKTSLDMWPPCPLAYVIRARMRG